MRWLCVLLLLAAGCGRIEYGDSDRRVVHVAPTSGGAVPLTAYRAPAPVAPLPQAPGVVYVPWDPGAQPDAPPPMAYAPAPEGGAVRCGGAQRVRIHDRIVDGEGGPAVVATGGCIVEVSEAILRGVPAVVVQDQARVVMVESRIDGDLVSSGAAQISTRGCRHDRGNVVRF